MAPEGLKFLTTLILKNYLEREFMKRLICLIFIVGCGQEQVSTSGVHRVQTTVQTGSDGLTTEQRNISLRLEMDNRPGSIKHLYLLSPFNGRQIFYSTVRGKISSSGKRLSPKTVAWKLNATGVSDKGVPVKVNGETLVTNELIQDDGTFGDSSEYLYFWNESGQYFQLYVGGLTVVVSDQPTGFQDVVIRNERE